MTNEQCLSQLDGMLTHLDLEELAKIPQVIKQYISTKKDKEYNWEYDKTKKFEEQNIDRKTISMLSYLNMEYLLNDEQRDVLHKMHVYNEQNIEKEKMEKYSMDNIFNKKVEVQSEPKEQMAIVEVKPKKWFERLWLHIKGIFCKK